LAEIKKWFHVSVTPLTVLNLHNDKDENKLTETVSYSELWTNW